MQSQTRLSLAIILCGAIISASYTAYARVDFAYVSEQTKNSLGNILSKVVDYKNAAAEVNTLGVGTNCKEIYPGWNGPINDRINLVFLSSKFSTEDQFLTKAKSLLNVYGDSNSFFSFEPAKSNKNKFNFWYVNRQFNTDYPEMYQYDCDISTKVKVNVYLKKGFFGGLANYGAPTRSITISGEPVVDYIELFHEFSHALANLSDEYEGQVGMWKNPSIPNCESATSESACQNWCKGPPVDLTVLKNENCSKLTTNQCYSSIDSGSPCRDLSDFTGADGVWGKGRSCVNTVALCTSLTDENTCNNVRNDPRDVSLCSWVTSIYGVQDHPYFKSKCIPASNNFNIGTQCIADTGCYNGCGFSRGIFRSKKEGLMQSISPGVTLGGYNEKLMCDRIKSDTGSVGGKCDLLFSLFNNTTNATISTAVSITPVIISPVATTTSSVQVSTPITPTQTTADTITQLQSQLQDLQNQLAQLQNQQTTATTTSNTGSTTSSTPTTSAPTLVFNSSFSNTSYGVEYYILSWGSVDATSCSSNWKPSTLPTSGYENMAISSGAPATFTLTCTGAGGSTSKTISVGGTSATPATPLTSPIVTTQPVIAPTTSTIATTTTPTTTPTITTIVPTVISSQPTPIPTLTLTTAIVNPGFTITFPTVGWNLEMGESYTIGWRYANNTGNLATARLSLYQGGSYKDSIAIDVPNNGSYVWKVPAALSVGSDYSIRLFNISVSNSYIDSAPFSIVPKGGIITTTTAVTSATTPIPTASTATTPTTPLTTSSISSTTSTTTSTPVTSNTSSTPSTGSQTTTTTTTTVTSPGFVVTAPSSGTSVNAGSTYTIRWQYASNAGDLSTTRLSLYQNGGYKDFIAIDIPNSGSYSWSVPFSLSGSGYLIRLFNLSYSNDYADSGSFSITAASASSGQVNALASALESIQSLLNDLAISVKGLIK